MDFASYQRMSFERRGRELRVLIDNGRMNAVDFEMHEELARLFPSSTLLTITPSGFGK